jgi:hypothetical protein
MGDFKGSYLTPFPFLRAIYLTCLWVNQSLEYKEKCKEADDLIFKREIKCKDCDGIKIIRTDSWLSSYCHIDRFHDTLSYCRSTRTKLFGMI